ncbi:MAG: hypothetical protein P1V36_13475, partial [Planctomycetota bacterium]|nr:hypothetical protein [Planctomycetota bacterium]
GRNGILIARAAPSVHARVDAALTSMRAHAAKPDIAPELARALRAAKVSVTLDGVTVADALKTLQIQTGHNLMLDPRLGEATTQKVLGKLAMSDAALFDVLEAIRLEAGTDLVWRSQGSVLVLTRRAFVPIR